MFCYNLDTDSFKEIVFLLYMHHQLTNIFQVITKIEKYIKKWYPSAGDVKLDVRSRSWRVGTKDWVERGFNISCSYGGELLGKSRFCPLNMENEKGVDKY